MKTILHRTLAAVLAVALPVAGSGDDWVEVAKVKPGSELLVETADGMAVRGNVAAVDAERLDLADPRGRVAEAVRAGRERGVSLRQEALGATRRVLLALPRTAVKCVDEPAGTGAAIAGGIGGAILGAAGGFLAGVLLTRDLSGAGLGMAVGVPVMALVGAKRTRRAQARRIYTAPASAPAR